ncbi:hypothetical protein [Streptomyces cyaneofuscatus]
MKIPTGWVFTHIVRCDGKSITHIGQMHDHTHRMGLLLAARTSTLIDHF